jgi:hypothetical protein
MERAILEEAQHPEHAAIRSAALETETLLDAPAWESAPAPPAGRGSLRIEAIGRTATTADGGARVELVLIDAEGRRSRTALVFRIDPLPEDDRG